MITTVTNEIKYLIKEIYNGHSVDTEKYRKNFTPLQRDAWHKIDLGQLCNSHTDCIRLLEDDGFDGKPVFDNPYATTQHYTGDTETGKRFPSDDKLIRFGIFSHMDLIQNLVFLLKNRWEHFFIPYLGGHKAIWQPADYLPAESQTEDNLDWQLKAFESKINKKQLNKRFYDIVQKDIAPIYDALLKYEFFNSSGPSLESLHAIILEIINKKYFLRPIWGRQVSDFSSQKRQELNLVSGDEKRHAETYWITKRAYFGKLNELGEMLYKTEESKIEQLSTELKWNSLFGANYIRILELQNTIIELKDRQSLLMEEKDRTEEEIELELEVKRKDREAEIQSLQEAVSQAIYLELYVSNNNNFQTLSKEEFSDIQDEGKRLLRQIYLLSHPDITRTHTFSSQQLEFLDNQFKEGLSLKPHDKDLALGRIQINRLQRILNDIHEIFRDLGINEQGRLQIPPEIQDIRDKIEYYETQIKTLVEEINNLKSDLLVLVENRAHIERWTNLTSDNAIADYNKQQQERIAELEKQIEEIKKSAA